MMHTMPQGSGMDRELHSSRALVVDDSPTSRKIVQRYLEGWGLQADPVPTAEEALSLMQRASSAGSPYAIVVLDLNLPGMDGFALARTIQRDRALAHTPLILLTAFDGQGRDAEALAAGFSAYLTKPVN